MLSHFTPLAPGQALLLQWVFAGGRPLAKNPRRRKWPFRQVDEKDYQAKAGTHTFLAVARIAAKGPNPRAMLKLVGTAFHSLRTDGVQFTDRRVPWAILKHRITERSVPRRNPPEEPRSVMVVDPARALARYQIDVNRLEMGARLQAPFRLSQTDSCAEP